MPTAGGNDRIRHTAAEQHSCLPGSFPRCSKSSRRLGQCMLIVHHPCKEEANFSHVAVIRGKLAGSSR